VSSFLKRARENETVESTELAPPEPKRLKISYSEAEFSSEKFPLVRRQFYNFMSKAAGYSKHDYISFIEKYGHAKLFEFMSSDTFPTVLDAVQNGQIRDKPTRVIFPSAKVFQVQTTILAEAAILYSLRTKTILILNGGYMSDEALE
jgi:hypothetical protein